MEPDDFNSIPKDAIMIIGDMGKFEEFIAFNAATKAMQKIILSLYSNRKGYTSLLEKYITKHAEALRKFIRNEITKYEYKPSDVDKDKEENTFKNTDYEDAYNEMKEGTFRLKRGDIDRVVISSTNTILFDILGEMTKDKILNLCWDGENSDFIWVLRKPNEPDKVETKFKKDQKNKTKKTK